MKFQILVIAFLCSAAASAQTAKQECRLGLGTGFDMLTTSDLLTETEADTLLSKVSASLKTKGFASCRYMGYHNDCTHTLDLKYEMATKESNAGVTYFKLNGNDSQGEYGIASLKVMKFNLKAFKKSERALFLETAETLLNAVSALPDCK